MNFTILITTALCLLLSLCTFAFAEEKYPLSKEQKETISSIEKLTDYEELNVYSMEIRYEYNLDHLTPAGVYDTQALMDCVLAEVLPGLHVNFSAPEFGCSAFSLETPEANRLMGRNYDFKFDTSAMIVHCHPKDGYESVAHAALDNINANDPFASPEANLACLTAPFVCLDGINEKGVGIAVLTLDSEPTVQNTGKPVLSTPILIRLVLDRAASTEEAVGLLKGYDIYSTSGRDYHFFITDACGDSRVVEFDCDSPERTTVVTPIRSITNFYGLYKDNVLPHQKNGVYGHGKERYDAIEQVIEENGGTGDRSVAWKALIAASQEPNPESITSNTQWSIVYDLTDLSYEFVLHRRWNDPLAINTLKSAVEGK